MDLRFSQRMGQSPISKPIQLTSIDNDLRNSLWNAVKMFVLDKQNKHKLSSLDKITQMETFSRVLWLDYYKLPIDTIPNNSEAHIRNVFYMSKWFEIYDFIEFTIAMEDGYGGGFRINTTEYINYCNLILQREFSGYRIIQRQFAPITNEQEINSISTAIDSTSVFTQLAGANIHLKAALNKLSDKQNPDYRNSVKESISAVESIAKVISEGSNDTLGSALDKIKGKAKIHPAMERGFKSLYGYTSDGSGIRHALMDESEVDFNDAKFMLVSCSAFVNYLITKAEKLGMFKAGA
jgi:hypothetical protein